MDWALLVELVKVIAWPVVVVIGIREARKIDLKAFADRIKRLKLGPGEIETHEVPKVSAPASTPLLPAPASTPLLPASENRGGEITEPVDATPGDVTSAASGEVSGTSTAKAISAVPLPSAEPEPRPAAEPALIEYAPAGAIVNAWSRLEQVMRREVARFGAAGTRTSPTRLIHELEALGILVDDNHKAVLDMNLLRNEVTHSGRIPTQDAAAQFVETVDNLIRRIEDGANRLRLAQMLEQLGHPPPGVIHVSPKAIPDGVVIQRSLVDRFWQASAFRNTISIGERDAALLISYGAVSIRDVK